MQYRHTELKYHSERYNKYITVPKGFKSDGATNAPDIYQENGRYANSIWVHDYLCEVGIFDDGTKCSNWQASAILMDMLIDESRYVKSITWSLATFFFGGGRCRDNGMFYAR